MDPAPVPVKRYHGIVRLAHWLNAVVLLGMIASGLQIYMAYRHFGLRDAPPLPNPLDGKSIPEWGRLGGWLAGGLNWHFALAWPFVLTGLLYLGFLLVSGAVLCAVYMADQSSYDPHLFAIGTGGLLSLACGVIAVVLINKRADSVIQRLASSETIAP